MVARIVTAKHPIVGNDTQPQALPFVSAKMSGARMRAMSTVPAKSIDRDRVGSLDSRTARSVTGTHSTAMTASIQNSPCQPSVDASRPPTSGPAAAPTADAAPQSVTARSWALPVFDAESRLMPHARIVAPAAPWMHRPAMTPTPSCESAMSTHDAMKRNRPPRKIRRRPNTSPSEPDVTITAAPTSE